MKEDYRQRLISLVEGFMSDSGLNYSKVATMLNRDGKPMSRQGFFKMVKGGSLKVTTLLEVLDAAGYELEIRKKEVPK